MKFLNFETYIKVAYDPSRENIDAWNKEYQKYQEDFSKVRSYLSEEFLRFYDLTHLHDAVLRRIEISVDDLIHPLIKIYWHDATTRKDFCLEYYNVINYRCSAINFSDDEIPNYLFGEILISHGIFSHEFILGNEVVFSIECRGINYSITI